MKERLAFSAAHDESIAPARDIAHVARSANEIHGNATTGKIRLLVTTGRLFRRPTFRNGRSWETAKGIIADSLRTAGWDISKIIGPGTSGYMQQPFDLSSQMGKSFVTIPVSTASHFRQRRGADVQKSPKRLAKFITRRLRKCRALNSSKNVMFSSVEVTRVLASLLRGHVV